MKRFRIILLILILAAAAGAFYYYRFYQNGGNGSEIRTSGHVEVTEVDLSFRIPGHVERLLVEEGDQVEAGRLLAELKRNVLEAKLRQARAQLDELEASAKSLELAIRIKEDQIEAQVNQAQAQVDAAEARLGSLQTGSRREEIKAAQAVMTKAEAEYENRLKNFRRMRELYDRKTVSRSQFEDAEAALEAARSSFEAAQEQYKLVKIGPRKESIQEGQANLSGTQAVLQAAETGRREAAKMKIDLEALRARQEQARAALDVAEDDLAESSLRAPFAGFVTVKDVEEGEYVQVGSPVLSLARLDEVWVKTYIPETSLGRVKLGREAVVLSDSYPGKEYLGRVTYISPEAEFTPKNVQTQEERIKLVYRIKVTLDNPDQELKAGMPVDVVLR